MPNLTCTWRITIQAAIGSSNNPCYSVQAVKVNLIILIYGVITLSQYNPKGEVEYTATDRLSTDHDPLFQFHRWQANLRILDVESVQTVPQVPWSHPFIERLIATIRGEYLDRLFFWTAGDLERKLELFKNYYNAARVHQGLFSNTPGEKAGRTTPQAAGLENYRWQTIAKCVILTQPLSPQMLQIEAGISNASKLFQFGQITSPASVCADEGTGVPSNAQFPPGGL